MSGGIQIVVTHNPETGSLGVAAPPGMPIGVVLSILQAACTTLLIQQIKGELAQAQPRIVQLDDVPPEVRKRLQEGGP